MTDEARRLVERKIVLASPLLQSLDWARRQGILSCELRTAMSLARSQRDRGESREARDLLGAVYGRFAQGFGTADLQ